MPKSSSAKRTPGVLRAVGALQVRDRGRLGELEAEDVGRQAGLADLRLEEIEELAMRSATIGIQYLLASRGLEFSTVTGFTRRRSTNEEREAQLRDTEYVDRSYWSDYDYFMHARDLRALRRARVHA